MHSIIAHYPSLAFEPADRFCWSPAMQTIYYDVWHIGQDSGQLALLHEIGHAQLNHNEYSLDVELLNMEVQAWAYARQYAHQFHITIDEEHIDQCLEGYRIWLYKRSLCPVCDCHGLQIRARLYRCFMCRHQWRVAPTLTLQPRRQQCQSSWQGAP